MILEVLFIEKFLETGKKRYAVGLILDPILLANCHAALFPVYLVVFLPFIAEYLITFITRKNIYKLRIKKKEFGIKRLNKKISKFEELLKDETQNTEKLNKKLLKKNKKLEKRKSKLTKLNYKNEFLNKVKIEKQKDGKIILQRNKYSKFLVIIFIICIFTGLVTPIGDIPYTYMIKSIQGNTMNFISEHQSVALINDYSLLAIFAVILILIFSNKLKIKLADLFMLIGMSILALISYKQFPIFLICTMCIINKLILELARNIKAKREDRKKKIQEQLMSEFQGGNKEDFSEISLEEKALNEVCGKENKFLKFGKGLVKVVLTLRGTVIVILIILVIALLQYKNIATQSYVDSSSYPTLAADWINENLDVENMRLFNDFNYGSYLLFRDIPVFIDGRADAYDPVFNGREDDSFLAYMSASSLSIWYEDVLREYDITHVITTCSSSFNTYLQRNVALKTIYNDGTFIIYETRFDEIDG